MCVGGPQLLCENVIFGVRCAFDVLTFTYIIVKLNLYGIFEKIINCIEKRIKGAQYSIYLILL